MLQKKKEGKTEMQSPCTSSTALQNPGLACCVSGARLVQDLLSPFSPVASACAAISGNLSVCWYTLWRGGLSGNTPLLPDSLPPGRPRLPAFSHLEMKPSGPASAPLECEKGRNSGPLPKNCPSNFPPSMNEVTPSSGLKVLPREGGGGLRMWRGRGPRKPRLSSLGASNFIFFQMRCNSHSMQFTV